MKASTTTGMTVARLGRQAPCRRDSKFRDNSYNHNSYLQEADMSS
jgi:hypothetical protein